jgi:Transcriptional regulator, AbiEi antitoxin
VPLRAAEFGPRSVDREIAGRARRQHGVVTRAQIREMGLGEAAITQRIAAGRLHVVHAGVYAVGHTVLTRSGRWMAAVLACGPDAALSHASAAALWALQRGEPTVVDVTTNRSGRKRPGIRIHRPRRPAETTTHDRIPVTTPARTILDLAAIVTRSRLEHLLDEAERRELTDYPALDARHEPTRGYRTPLHRSPAHAATRRGRPGDPRRPRRPPRRLTARAEPGVQCPHAAKARPVRELRAHAPRDG